MNESRSGPSAAERKQLKQQYRETSRPMGVFRIRHRATGRTFVGSSVTLPAIGNRMRTQLRTGTCVKHPELQRDWNEHGPEAFEFEVLAELEPSEEPGYDPTRDLAALEALWLEELTPFDERGYNRRPR